MKVLGQASPLYSYLGGQRTRQNSRAFNTNPEADIVFSDGEYQISFWIKRYQSFGFAQVKLIIDGSDEYLLESDLSTVMNYWTYQTYNFTSDERFDGSEIVELIITEGQNVLIDNFKITKIENVNYLIKDSWYIPASCDNELAYQPVNEDDRNLMRAMVGCREYQDTDDTLHYLKGFSSLCYSDQVGCEALIDTKNTSAYSPEAIMLENSALSCEDGRSCDEGSDCIGIGNELCEIRSAEVAFNADELIYLVNNKDAQCPAEQKGCTAFGLPELTKQQAQITLYDNTDPGNPIPYLYEAAIQSVNNVDGKDVYFDYFYLLDLDDLEVAPSVLCSIDELACEEYVTDEGDTYYFKDPVGRFCEYRMGTDINNSTSEGWWQSIISILIFTAADHSAH